MSLEHSDRGEKPDTSDRATSLTGGQYWTSAEMNVLKNGADTTRVTDLGFPDLTINDETGTGSRSDSVKPPAPPPKKPPTRECSIDQDTGEEICTGWHD